MAVIGVQAATFAQIVPLAAAANYDEGTYLASADALRHGQQLGTEIFTSQPPGWYYLLAAVQMAVGRSVEGQRAVLLLLALGASLATYFLVRELVGHSGGIAAAAAVGVGPAYATFSAQIVADIPALALALTSLALAAAAFARRPASVWLAAVSGLTLTAAVSVKLTALTALVPLVGFALVRRPPLRVSLTLAASALTAASALVLAHLGALAELWDGVVTYHRQAAELPDVPTVGANVYRLREFFLDPGTALFWIGCAGALAFIFGLSVRARIAVLPLWAWTAVAAYMLAETRPLHENHYTLLSVAVAVPVGASLGAAISRVRSEQLRAAAAAGVIALLIWGYVDDGIRLAEEPRTDGPDIEWSVRRVTEATAPGEFVAADRPIVAFLADRRLPGELVDTAFLRFATGSLTSAEVLEQIQRQDVRAVVAGREFRHHPGLLRRLESSSTGETRDGVSFYFRR